MKILVVATLLACGCARDHQVTLRYTSVEARGGVSPDLPAGFHCLFLQPSLSQQCPAFERSFVSDPATHCQMMPPATEARFHVVVDILAMAPGAPTSCLPIEIAEWCTQNQSCLPVAAMRRCLDVDLADGAAAYLGGTVGAEVEAQLAGQMGIEDAPHDPVLVRAVATTQSCADLLALGPSDPFDRAQLVGCARSCPVSLDSVDQLDLVLDVTQGVANECGGELVSCASPPRLMP